MQNYSTYYCNYTIGEDGYKDVPGVCSRYGTKILLIGGEKAMEAARSKLDAALAGSNLEIVDAVLYGRDCTHETITKLADHAKNLHVDMIFGMGGGKALDTAKGAACEAGLPVFTFPTIAATCAATTALSVVYHEDSSFDEFYFYDRPAVHSFIDLSVIAKAPAIYLQAGMGDTIGKYFECHFAARGDQLAHPSALGRAISSMCYFPLRECGVQALRDCKEGLCTEALREAVLANIVSTGLVSLMVLDQYNCAVAHSVYYGLVCIPGFEEENLHGNVVAYGVLVQLAVDGQIDEAKDLKQFLQDMEIRTTLKEMGVELKREDMGAVLKEIVTGPDMEHIPYPIDEDMIFRGMEIVESL